MLAFLRMALLILWTVLSVIPFFVVILLRFRNPSLFKDYLLVYAPVACAILGIRVRLEGLTLEQIEPSQPCVFVGNHQSGLDVITYSYLKYKRTVTVGKKEILYVPFFGQLFWATGNIMIDRSKSRDAISKLTLVARAIRGRNVSIVMFPEGTRNRKFSGMLPFKKGAFHIAITAKVPIIPLICSSLSNLFDEKGRIKGGEVLIRVLDPISTQGLGQGDVDRLLLEVRAKMEVALAEVNAKVGHNGAG